MALALTGTTPNYFKDSSSPLVSYTSQGATIVLGQLILNSATGDIYICTDASNQAALVWKKLPNGTEISQFQSQSDWNQATSSDPSFINNKPTIPSSQINSDWSSSTGLSQILNKPSLSSVATTGSYADLSGKPSLSTVATTGSYNDLSSKPTIPSAQVNSDWSSASGASQILNKPTIPAVQIQSDWSQASSGALDFIKNKPTIPSIPTRSQSSVSRSLNTAFQISATRDSLVNYSVDISCTMSLTSGQTGTVFLEIASDSGFTTNVQELARGVNGNTGALTIGLNLTQIGTATISGYVPSSYYCRIRTANTSSTPTFNYRSGQEILL